MELTVTTAPDWECIEADYRAGLLSLRAIAAKDGHVTEGAIRKKARKFEWERDLKARIRAKAEELVRNDTVRSVGPQYATACEAAETAIVQDSAQILAHVELSHRKDISKARQIVVSLFAELESAAGERLTVELINDPLIQSSAGSTASQARGAPRKAISLPAMAATVKALTDALRTLVMIEREVWGLGMDDGRSASANPRVIDSSKLSWDERQQLRAMILRIQPGSSGDSETPVAGENE